MKKSLDINSLVAARGTQPPITNFNTPISNTYSQPTSQPSPMSQNNFDNDLNKSNSGLSDSGANDHVEPEKPKYVFTTTKKE